MVFQWSARLRKRKTIYDKLCADIEEFMTISYKDGEEVQEAEEELIKRIIGVSGRAF